MLRQLEQDSDAEKWRDQIATPGGMSAEGLAVLHQSGLEKIVKDAFAKTLDKAKSLS
jgi:pyrroline-5-carboxylate reductase